MLRLSMGLLALFAENISVAHTVKFEDEIVRGACISTDRVAESHWLIFRQESTRVTYVDGYISASAVIVPTKPLPHDLPDDDMTICAKKTQSEFRNSKSAQPNSMPDEEAFKLQLNKCLADRGAKYEAAVVILHRGELRCPPEARER